MTVNELKKLKRSNLIELIMAQNKENEALRAQLNQMSLQLKDKSLKINNAGSIAEASLQLSGIFQAAEEACSQYLENIEKLSTQQEEVCAALEAESRAKADQLVAEAEQKVRELENEAQKKYDEMTAKAEADSKAYWLEVSEKLEQFYADHQGLKQLLADK